MKKKDLILIFQVLLKLLSLNKQNDVVKDVLTIEVVNRLKELRDEIDNEMDEDLN